jgi:O-antigen ligase
VGVALVGLLQRRGIDLTPTEGTGMCFSDYSVRDGGIVRTSSVFCHPNNLALWLGRVSPVALVLLNSAGLRLRALWPGRPRDWLAGALYLGSFLITGLSMLLTYSKGARFAGAAVLVALSLLPRRWWFTALTLVVLGGALAYSSFNGPERLDVGGDSSSARLSIWRSAVAMLADHPLAGVGMGQFYYNFNPDFGHGYIEPMLRDDPAESKTAHPHNLVLDLLLRVGLFGAVVFAALVGRAGWRGWRLCR